MHTFKRSHQVSWDGDCFYNCMKHVPSIKQINYPHFFSNPIIKTFILQGIDRTSNLKHSSKLKLQRDKQNTPKNLYYTCNSFSKLSKLFFFSNEHRRTITLLELLNWFKLSMEISVTLTEEKSYIKRTFPSDCLASICYLSIMMCFSFSNSC